LINVDGKDVFTELDELADPRHTALLLVDMQQDFVAADGAFAAMGIDVSMYAGVRTRLAGLLAAARHRGVLVVHIKNTALEDRRSDSPAQIRFNLRMHQLARAGGPPLRYTLPGTPGHEFVEDLNPQPGELVVPKYRSSAFWGTSLELLLRSNGIKTVILSGCTTEGCVESTARDALFCDHYVVIAEDCVGSDDREQHHASMLLMRHRFDVVPAAAIQQVWAAP
jgi:nicotinamidase-related amidase